MSTEPEPHVFSAAIRYSDLDAQGHVNNAVFLMFFDDARIEFFRHVGIPQAGIPPEAETGTSRVIARTEIDYLAPLMYEQEPIQIVTRVLAMGSKSFTIGQDVVCRGTVCARAKVVLVAYDAANGTTRPLDDYERNGLGPLLVSAS